MTDIEELIENGDTHIRYTRDITKAANITQWVEGEDPSVKLNYYNSVVI